MCPPAPIPSAAIELDIYSTDETICKLLMQLQSGHTPPQNVLSDVDPYQYPPSNLPADMWYFSSGSKIDTKFGFWRSTGEACKVYSTTLIVGLRKTLQFYEGPVHDLQKTNWMMQEYTTTELYTSKLDPRALCRVFLVDDSSSGGFKNEHFVKNIDDVAVAVAGPSDVANQCLDQVLDDYVSEGDYLELDDLATPLSRTTSSADSSCMTMSSEELFDSDALLRELGDDVVDQEIQDSRIKLNLSAPAELTQVVMQPTTLGSVDQVNESEPCKGQTSKTNSTTEDKGTPNEADTAPPPLSSPPPPSSPPPLSPTPLSQLPSSSTAPPPPPPPPSQPPLPPSSSNNRTKRRKMIKYLCFLAF
ncbi:putative transcription factor NAM family [Helianthus annuus]|uniref:Putative NAC domain-containing protein n=1 Tax=Helianthus annuus TaxID=4232 RepID=A0A251U1N6_HELAN|nr:formin-like protein 2 [Helianthus annuus]KAF5792454.1 putative transcription factor NAM family [Helianthus annuus]KAJ0527393.1 putative transcription factor NAM family [Helianthus annuus]KAJ0543795.1 putative transcription factor NAM family [Helianthus annuus]KAJ0708850.1 putative transcription factor NAM family [Helianthus annuus]KAJ0889930.1 putative transcription factor NAM family [Helianthus annuus]